MALGVKVTLTAKLTVSLVGALAFSSLITMITQTTTTMVNTIAQLVMGVALVGRMVPSSILQDIATVG